LEVDRSEDVLFSAGKEGVIVFWNLKTETKNFIPRVSSEILSLTISSDSAYLSAFCQDKSIKIVNLFKMTFENEFSSICLNTILKDYYNNILRYKIRNDDCMLMFNSNSGKVQLFNINQMKLYDSICFLNKNQISSTEKERVNMRQLKLIEISRPKLEYLLTYEELSDNLDKEFLISNLKFWKTGDCLVNGFKDLSLICIAENAHRNEKINEIHSNFDCFITVSETFFKVWKFNKDKDKDIFTCIMTCSYKKETISTVLLTQNSKILCLFSGKYLIEWDIEQQEYTRMYSFDGDKCLNNFFKSVLITNNLDQAAIFYNNSEFIIFSIDKWEISSQEKFTNFEIKKITPFLQDNTNYYSIILQVLTNLNTFIVHKISTSDRDIIESSHVISKNNLKYVDVCKEGRNYIIANGNTDLFLMKKNTPTEIKKKEIAIDNDDEDFVLPSKQKLLLSEKK
jgi:hypothetical protein